MIEQLYTTQQLADMLGLQPKTIANSRYTGTGINIPFIKIGSSGVVRYKKSEVEAYLDENTFQHNGETKVEV